MKAVMIALVVFSLLYGAGARSADFRIWLGAPVPEAGSLVAYPVFINSELATVVVQLGIEFDSAELTFSHVDVGSANSSGWQAFSNNITDPASATSEQNYLIRLSGLDAAIVSSTTAPDLEVARIVFDGLEDNPTVQIVADPALTAFGCLTACEPTNVSPIIGASFSIVAIGVSANETEISYAVRLASPLDVHALTFTLEYDSQSLSFDLASEVYYQPGAALNGTDYNLRVVTLQTNSSESSTIRKLLVTIESSQGPYMRGSNLEVAVFKFAVRDTSSRPTVNLNQDCSDSFLTVADPFGNLAVRCFRAENPGQTVGVDSEPNAQLPEEFALYQNYPNPFNAETTIRFDVPRPDFIKIGIFNIQGRLVRTLINREIEAGFHQVAWNARDDRGELVGSGIYFLRFQSTDLTQVRRSILLK